MFLYSQNCRFGLIGITHGLNQDKVSTGFFPCFDRFRVKGHGLFKREVSIRLEKLTRRS